MAIPVGVVLLSLRRLSPLCWRRCGGWVKPEFWMGGFLRAVWVGETGRGGIVGWQAAGRVELSFKC